MAGRKVGHHGSTFQNAGLTDDISGEEETGASQTVQTQDYEFVPPLDSKYECPICMMVLRDPLQTECGHRYCKACINKWLREQGGPQCPLCKEHLSEGMLFPDNFAKREILSLKVKCARVKRGCTSIVELKYMEEHLQSQCGYVPVPCPLKCAKKVWRKDVQSHVEESCTHRTVKCEQCEELVEYCSLHDHQSRCPGREVKCDLCRISVKHSELSTHWMNDCPQAERTCHFDAVGCEFKGNISDISLHKRNMLVHHLDLLLISVASPHGETDVCQTVTGAGTEHSLSLNLSSTGGLVSTTRDAPTSDPAITSGFVDNSHEYPTFASTSGTSTEISMQTVRPYSYPFTLGRPVSSREHAPRGTGSPADGAHLGHHLGHHGYSTAGVATNKDVHELKTELIKVSDELKQKDRKIKQQDEIIKGLELSIQEFEQRHCNGNFLWKITDYSKKRQDALIGRTTVIHSPGFYSSVYGYKLCIRANLNGVESGVGSHMSLFVHFMKGDYDDLLEWPFHGQITIIIMDQNENCDSRLHFSETLVTKPHLAAFQKPSSNRNHKGFGYIEFAPLQQIVNEPYVKNDTLVIKALVESKNG